MLNPVSPLPLKDPTLFRQANYLDGKWVEADGGKSIVVKNPATFEAIGEVPAMGAAETRRAIEAAHRAFPAWRAMLAKERRAILRKLSDLMLANTDDLGVIMTAEQGKPLSESKGEITYAASFIEWFADEALRLYGDTIPQNAQGRRILVLKEPIGVFAAITPWNFPSAMITRKAGPGWAAGCTGVIRPASQTPFSALALAVLAERAGMPAGVCNVLTGPSGAMGAELTGNPLVRKLSFTGSTEVGKIIMRAAAERIVPVSLELGGKSPSIVYPDADEDWVVDGVIAGMRFTRQSQSCTAGSRLFLHADIFDSFLDKLSAKTQALKLGDPLDETNDIGCIINEKQFRKVCGYVDDGLNRKDARLVFGGLPPKDGPLSEGYFAIPTVFADTSNDWRLAREEIFGPVLVAIPWRNEEDAIRMANDSHYGLAAYVWTHEIGSGLRAAHAIESGWVQVNQGLGQQPGHSYGGYKQSGIGREFSLEGMLDSFTQRKNVTVNLNVPRRT